MQCTSSNERLIKFNEFILRVGAICVLCVPISESHSNSIKQMEER